MLHEQSALQIGKNSFDIQILGQDDSVSYGLLFLYQPQRLNHDRKVYDWLGFDVVDDAVFRTW